jgi:hypothetical protein
MDKTKHLKTKYSVARFSLITKCSGDELRFYLYVKLYAINQNSAFPSHKSFNRDLGWSKYTINRIARKMEKIGRLKVLRSRGKNNIYDITWYDRQNDKSSKETLTTSGRETLTTSRRETLTQTNRNKTNKNKTNELLFQLKDWNERQSSPIPNFKPENIVNKHGAEKIDKLIKEFGRENNGFHLFLEELRR